MQEIWGLMGSRIVSRLLGPRAFRFRGLLPRCRRRSLLAKYHGLSCESAFRSFLVFAQDLPNPLF
jgi:hypothetical protein